MHTCTHLREYSYESCMRSLYVCTHLNTYIHTYIMYLMHMVYAHAYSLFMQEYLVHNIQNGVVNCANDGLITTTYSHRDYIFHTHCSCACLKMNVCIHTFIHMYVRSVLIILLIHSELITHMIV